MIREISFAQRRTCVQRAILGLLASLIVTGLVTGGAYLYLRFSSSSGWSNPVGGLRSEQVNPPLALLGLTGMSDPEVVNRALADEELDTAYAAVLFSTQLSDAEQVGNLLLLGQGYAEAGDKGQARLCYQQANLIATLSPTLSDFAKANSYMEIGEGLAELGDREEALINYDQAQTVAVQSPSVKDRHRADILGQLATEYEALGEKATASECSALQAEILYSSGEPGEATGGSTEQPIAPFLVHIQEPTGAMVVSYEQRRVETVLELISFLQGAAPETAIPQDLATDIAQALVNEDNARRTAYEDQLAAAPSMVLRIGMADAQVDWLILKYRVALGGYGLRLVPAWEDDLAHVEAELDAAHGELHSMYNEQISTFSDDAAKDRAWYDVLRLEIQQGRLGLYPDYPEEELISQLTAVAERLIGSGDLVLHPEVLYEDDIPLFRLGTSEEPVSNP